MLDKGMPAMQSGLALQCCRHKRKEKGEVDRGDERGAKGMRQVRRGAGEEERKCGKRRREGGREDERRQEGTGYGVSLKSLRGSGGRGRDERRG